MISEADLRAMFMTQAAGVIMMQRHPEDYQVKEYESAITRVFTMGEILEYSDQEIADELNITMSDEARAYLDEAKKDLNHEVERLRGRDPYEDLDHNDSTMAPER